MLYPSAGWTNGPIRIRFMGSEFYRLCRHLSQGGVGGPCFWRDSPPVGKGHLIHEISRSQRRTAVGRTPLDEWPARCQDLYLTTRTKHNRQTSMPPGGIRTHNLSRRPAADLSLRPSGHGDRLKRPFSLYESLTFWRLMSTVVVVPHR